MNHASVSESDGFDRIPDSLVILIFNQISDVKTLIACRAVSKRFNSLVPQADSLLLRVDRVISAGEPEDEDYDSLLLTFFRSIFKSLHDLVSPKPLPFPYRTQNYPTHILRGFDRIRELEIELPSGDLRLEKGTVIRWKAVFGKTLRSCVILGFRARGVCDGGLKMRVVWTISALIAASARHYMVLEVVREHKHLEKLVVKDREIKGTVVIDEFGLRECRESNANGDEEEEEEEEQEEEESGNVSGVWWRNNRTMVPAVKMRMRHEPLLELSGGFRMEGATLVVVRPSVETEAAEDRFGDAGLSLGAFGGTYDDAVERLLKSRSYVLEMNSF